MRVRSLIAVACALSLNGCSYVYDIVATKIGGKLAFVHAPVWMHNPDCINSIEVSAEAEVHAEPEPGDDRASVLTGMFWKRTFDVTGCENPFPVFYGAPLRGKPFRTYHFENANSLVPDPLPDGAESLRAGVRAKPLRVGIVYDVHATSRGSGYGGGRFRLLADGSVENLSSDQAASSSPPR